MRIYIVGAAGGGKTTMARNISKALGIKCYHLDDIYYSNDTADEGGIRLSGETKILFDEIINCAEWIAEDNGSRDCFYEIMEKADKIILLYPPKYIRNVRIIKRYIKQKLGLEKAEYRPKIEIIKRMINGSNNFEDENSKVRVQLLKHKEKTVVLKTKRDINEYIKKDLQ